MVEFLLGVDVDVSLLCVDVFFFKQKTAYEMRISDWSSDVCSSDLLTEVDGALIVGRLPWRLARKTAIAMSGEMLRGYRHPPVEEPWYGKQIGRASCRERVCQYV